MRILQVSSARTLGGGETHVLELVDALRYLGHEVVVAGCRNGPLHPQIELPFFNSADFYTVLRLREILKRQSFDIVHAHLARDYTVTAAAAWGIPKVKLVCTRHLLYPVRRHPLYRRVDGWIATTSQVLKSLHPLAPKVSTVIPNWVNAGKFVPRPRLLRAEITIGLLGQISPHKGHDTAIDAMRHLGDGFRLLVAGAGDPKYIAALNKRSIGLPVEFLGVVSPMDFFARIDLLIVPSWEEPFGIVVLEAMASGIPVIATNRGGPADIIPSALHGVLIPPKDSRSLADAVRSLAEDSERRAAISQHARTHIERNFDIRTIVPRIEDFYRRVMMRS